MADVKPPKITDEQTRLRVDVRRIASRVHASADISMESLATVIGYTKMYVWHLLTVESTNSWPITLDMVLAWSRDPTTQEFARRLLFEMIADADTQQMRLTDLQRFADSPFKHHNEIAVTVVRDLAERYGLIPANQTNTAEVKVPSTANGNGSK